MSTSQARKARLAEALASLGPTVERLSRLSQRSYQNPYTAVEWPAEVRPEEEWFGSPEYLSLYGTEFWERLDEAARRRLAFHEAANFYSLNIHGEKGLMQGLAERLYRKDLLDVAGYLHHFLDEENKHSIYFGGFCTRYAKVYRSRQFSFEESRDERPRDVEDFLFFTRTMIFEEIVDHYNLVQSRDSRLHPVARFINHNHHFEESRHLVFGRRLVAALWESCSPSWDGGTVAGVRDHLRQFFTTSWREYYNPDVYADAGLDEPWETAERAWLAPAQREHRRRVSRKVTTFLLSGGILDKEPVDAF
ncbi:diiron oxygenase [Streptomyces orinoci]|uniref:Diiron oxygenase n=1 Tax=Streptomyces orinoci TaxID=67339 RepID=A0ABV3K687_STRON|nr:diiron oxygenase [Streptomyces orinoci]